MRHGEYFKDEKQKITHILTCGVLFPNIKRIFIDKRYARANGHEFRGFIETLAAIGHSVCHVIVPVDTHCYKSNMKSRKNRNSRTDVFSLE
jgi:hypothetical protein